MTLAPNLLSPEELIFQELGSFAAAHELNLGVREIKAFAARIFSRLAGELLTQAEAAKILGVSSDMLHIYRRDGLITGIPKNGNRHRTHWLYQLTDVLELKTYRSKMKMTCGSPKSI